MRAQMGSAAISFFANIAEGKGRNNPKGVCWRQLCRIGKLFGVGQEAGIFGFRRKTRCLAEHHREVGLQPAKFDVIDVREETWARDDSPVRNGHAASRAETGTVKHEPCTLNPGASNFARLSIRANLRPTRLSLWLGKLSASPSGDVWTQDALLSSPGLFSPGIS